MQGFGNRSWVAGISLVLTLVIAGCATPRSPAPVEDRGTMTKAPSAPAVVVANPGGSPLTVDQQGRPLAGIENYGKPGYYAVRPGDTIRRIGLDTAQRWQDIARWNNLENPDQIEVGQVLRVIPPLGSGATAATSTDSGASARAATPTAGAAASSTTAASAAAVTAATAAAATATAPAPATATAPAASAPFKPPVTTSSVAPAAAASGDEDVGWIWPAQGSLIAGFDEVKNKGLDIAGKAGEPVLAAADGQVVYAGANLRAYGNLIILKHNGTYLTAYAHNQTLLVKEDQTVQKGQKIAEMGNSGTDRIKLHFEIRRQGKPVDPARYLPPR